MISQDPKYKCAKASVYYWKKQLRLNRDVETCQERLEWWGSILAEFRKDSLKGKGGRPKGALGKKNRPAKMPSVPKEVVQLEREVWVPPPLSWD
jgi:hypothetical protein